MVACFWIVDVVFVYSVEVFSLSRREMECKRKSFVASRICQNDTNGDNLFLDLEKKYFFYILHLLSDEESKILL